MIKQSHEETDGTGRCVAPDYEAECKRLQDKYNQLMEKYAALEADYRNMETACVRMSGQLEIVELIFGGRK